MSAAFVRTAASRFILTNETCHQIPFQTPCNSPARGFFMPSNIPIFPTSLESFPFAVGKYIFFLYPATGISPLFDP